jgi:hypothetical protein
VSKSFLRNLNKGVRDACNFESGVLIKDLNQARIIGLAFLQNEVLSGKPRGIARRMAGQNRMDGQADLIYEPEAKEFPSDFSPANKPATLRPGV